MMDLHAICHTCHHQHSLAHEPQGAARYWEDWLVKHPGHDVDLATGKPQWESYRHNADIKVSYVATATVTISLASLASSATFVAGQESAAQDNGTNKYVNATLKGKITVGTTPTINTQIRIYAFAALDDGPTWPDVFDGTDSAETLTSAGLGAGFLRLAAIIDVDAITSDVGYPFMSRPFSELFGGVPQDWGLFVAHNTGVALNSTAGNHVVKVDYEYFTVV